MSISFSSRRTHSSQTRSSGFTLVELLIVIAVIGILGAILFPVFARVRENGRRTACASNMRQFGLAFQQYIQDNNQKLPNAVDGSFGAGKTGGWTYYSTFGAAGVAPKFDPAQGSLFNYVKNAAVYVCPSDSEGRVSGQSYAANSCVFNKASTCGGGPGGDCRYGKSMVRFRDPTGWMLLGEEGRDTTNPKSSTDDGYLNLKDSTQGAAFQNYFSTRHFEGSTITFLDGHSKWYSQADIVRNRFQIGGPQVDASKTLADGCPPGVQ